jgi:Family of unknown function (DUF6011)
MTSEQFTSLVGYAMDATATFRHEHPRRRPVWAPPIPFPPGLVEALNELQRCQPCLDGNLQFGRLWTNWRFPRWGPTKINQFSLRLGTSRAGTVITTIDCYQDRWTIGPRYLSPYSNQEIDRRMFELRKTIRDLGLVVITDFLQAPETTALSGARLSGICCCCYRVLTDPLSVELGIGPECRKSSRRIFPSAVSRGEARSSGE